MSEMRRVTAICNGTVVDHIPAGRAIQVLRMLRLDIGRSNPISMVMNVPSANPVSYTHLTLPTSDLV